MKLLKAPENPTDQGMLWWIEMPEWYWVWYNGDEVVKRDIGPLVIREMWINLRTDKDP